MFQTKGFRDDKRKDSLHGICNPVGEANELTGKLTVVGLSGGERQSISETPEGRAPFGMRG